MKLTNLQLEAAGYIFEKANGNTHPDLLEKIIKKSGLDNFDISALEKTIIDGLNSGIYKNTPLRTSAYWVLSKRFNVDLIPSFKKWLKFEFENNRTEPMFQIMIALNNLEEPVFHKERSGYAIGETELNLRDAKIYLNLKKQ